MTKRNELELYSAVDRSNPHATFARSQGRQTLTIAGQKEFTIKLNSMLPFLKIWIAATPYNILANWNYRAEVQLSLRGTPVSTFPLEGYDERYLADDDYVSAFAVGIGSPSPDMLLLAWPNNGGSIGNVGLVPKRTVALCDEIKVLLKSCVLAGGLRVYAVVEQSNFQW